MIGLLITGHGHFATGIDSSLKLITGAEKHIACVDFAEGDSTDDLKEHLNEALDALSDCDGVLILSDLAGGSPFQCSVACKAARPSQEIEVLYGTNLPLLIEGALSADAYSSPLELAEALTASGKGAIGTFRFAPQEEEDILEDGI